MKKEKCNGARVRNAAFAAVLALVMCGCSANGVRVKLEKSETENESEQIITETPIVSGMSKDFLNEINAQLAEVIAEKTESFDEAAKRTQNDRNGKASLEITAEVMYNKKRLLSLVMESHEYTSGFNETQSRYAVTIDAAEEKQLCLSDLFCDDEYKNMLNARLEKLSLSDEYSDIWDKPTIGEEQNESFYLSDKGLIIYYRPYELSYYSRGFVEFTIPYSDLYGYLDPQYAALY